MIANAQQCFYRPIAAGFWNFFLSSSDFMWLHINRTQLHSKRTIEAILKSLLDNTADPRIVRILGQMGTALFKNSTERGLLHNAK